MATTNLTIRIDEELKAQLQELVSNLGMDITTFITMSAKQAVRMQALPFTPSIGTPNLETLKAKWEVEFLEAHPEIPRKKYSNAHSMIEEVLAEDDV